jgi:hypothetical protein
VVFNHKKVGNEIFNVFIQNYHEKVKKLSAFLFRTYDEVVLRLDNKKWSSIATVNS